MINNGFSSTPKRGKSWYGGGCTQAFVTGLTSFAGNMNGESVDWYVGCGPGFVSLIIPKEGNRYLIQGSGDVEAGEVRFGLLNEKGVVLSGGFRPALNFPPYPGTPKYRTAAEMLRISNSAAEYVKFWSDDFTAYGTPGGSMSHMVVDAKEGYCLEGANFVYGDPSNHAIHGPMTDQVFVSSNFFISKRLKAQAEAGIGAGYNRAKRLWELLIDRQYDCSDQQPQPQWPGSGITLSYFMKCLRDHGNISPEEGRMSPYVPEERGQGAICTHGLKTYTTNAFFGVARADHTDLFSCEWMAPNQPCISPFLPIYIGINEVPKALGTTEAFDLFEKLRAVLEYHPEYRSEITQYWTSFEIRTIEESYLIEAEAAKLADNRNIDGARSLLTQFVERKSREAVADGQEMLDFLNDLPILVKKAEVNLD